MKILGLWLGILGYTMLYVGLNNIQGHQISFLGAIRGDIPTGNAQSATDTGQQVGKTTASVIAGLPLSTKAPASTNTGIGYYQ